MTQLITIPVKSVDNARAIEGKLRAMINIWNCFANYVSYTKAADAADNKLNEADVEGWNVFGKFAS